MRPITSANEDKSAGGIASGLVVAVLILAAVAVAAFFYLGGEADVDVKTPDSKVTTTDNG